MEEAPQYICVVCERECAKGMHILSRFVCSDCESEIISTPVDDDLYEYFVERLRVLWCDLLSFDPDASGSRYS